MWATSANGSQSRTAQFFEQSGRAGHAETLVAAGAKAQLPARPEGTSRLRSDVETAKGMLRRGIVGATICHRMQW